MTFTAHSLEVQWCPVCRIFVLLYLVQQGENYHSSVPGKHVTSFLSHSLLMFGWQLARPWWHTTSAVVSCLSEVTSKFVECEECQFEVVSWQLLTVCRQTSKLQQAIFVNSKNLGIRIWRKNCVNYVKIKIVVRLRKSHIQTKCILFLPFDRCYIILP